MWIHFSIILIILELTHTHTHLKINKTKLNNGIETFYDIIIEYNFVNNYYGTTSPKFYDLVLVIETILF